MELRLTLFGVKRSIDLSRFARYRNAIVVLASALLVVPLILFLLRPAAAPDLAHGNVAGAQALLAGWAKGDMIVLVRHVERCDHSEATCLGSAEGITDRARAVAVGLGAQFERLGLAHTDLYNSPLIRAVQTSSYMFNSATSGQDWLFNCKGTLLHDALAHKVAGRNLVLVTHSECMEELEKELRVASSSFDYGSTLFLSTANGNAKAHLLGFLDPTDWR